jgi:hypothetical protein
MEALEGWGETRLPTSVETPTSPKSTFGHVGHQKPYSFTTTVNRFELADVQSLRFGIANEVADPRYCTRSTFVPTGRTQAQV